jgi:heme/copper-type cytochrome/quinol oxidase subunit 3
MAMVITTESMLFVGLLSSYFYLRATSDEWPLGGLPRPHLMPVVVFSAVLVASSAPVHLAERAIRRGRVGGLRVYLAIGLGVLFLALQGVEYSRERIAGTHDAYGSLFYTITGFHGAHVLVGLIMLTVVIVRAFKGHFGEARHEAVSNVAMYWHFVDAVWLVVFTSLYVTPLFR